MAEHDGRVAAFARNPARQLEHVGHGLGSQRAAGFDEGDLAEDRAISFCSFSLYSHTVESTEFLSNSQ